MENLYPLFEQNRILKKELLWSLRDYTFAHSQLEYQDYGAGILQGCEIKVHEDQLVVGPGIIKYGQFVCLRMEEEQIHYTAANQLQYLKMRVEIDRSSPDYIAYQTKLVLDKHMPEKDKEFELCRFHLRAGAQLRSKYKDFADMETEYDTINLIHADWQGLGGRTLAPAVTRYFAETVVQSESSGTEDQAFAYLCLNQSKAVSAVVLSGYIRQRMSQRLELVIKNQEKYEAMCAIAERLQQGRGAGGKNVKERHRILLD